MEIFCLLGLLSFLVKVVEIGIFAKLVFLHKLLLVFLSLYGFNDIPKRQRTLIDNFKYSFRAVLIETLLESSGNSGL